MVGLGSRNKDIQPKDHGSTTQGVSIASMKNSNDINAVVAIEIPTSHTHKPDVSTPKVKIMEERGKTQKSFNHT
jgi:hypothetical protein